MDPVKRKVTYRLYPTKIQAALLWSIFVLHQRLYNAALEQRIWAWKQNRVSVGFAEQCKEMTALRADDPKYAALNAQSCQVTLKRLQLAFQAFFRRVKKGETPGFPRFKALQRFSGFGFKSHGDGWKLIPGEKGKHGRLRLSGVGLIKVRGQARTMGEPKTMEIQHKRGRWYASVTMVCEPQRDHGTERIGFDWGIERFLTFQDGSGVENPSFLRRSEKKIKELQRAVSRKKRGSNNRRKAAIKVGREHERVANRRKDFLHKESAKLVARAELLATESLITKNMTRSAKGTLERPGKNVRQKAGLNRSILDGAPSAFVAMVRTKAAEAACVLVEAPTRRLKPSQTCPACGQKRKKKLSERTHRCECGCVMPRDQASAQVCLDHALSLLGLGTSPSVEGPTVPVKHETPSLAA